MRVNRKEQLAYRWQVRFDHRFEDRRKAFAECRRRFTFIVRLPNLFHTTRHDLLPQPHHGVRLSQLDHSLQAMLEPAVIRCVALTGPGVSPAGFASDASQFLPRQSNQAIHVPFPQSNALPKLLAQFRVPFRQRPDQRSQFLAALRVNVPSDLFIQCLLSSPFDP